MVSTRSVLVVEASEVAAAVVPAAVPGAAFVEADDSVALVAVFDPHALSAANPAKAAERAARRVKVGFKGICFRRRSNRALVAGTSV
jgi:hypothetical protein